MFLNRLKNRLGHYVETSASLGSAFGGGSAASLDKKNMALWNRIFRGRNPQDPQPFSITAKNRGKPYNTIWIKSLYDGYAVVETYAPDTNDQGITVLKPAFLVLACEDPSLLADIVLKNKPVTDPELLAKLRPVAARFKDQITSYSDAAHQKEEFNFTWAREAITNDSISFNDHLKQHGIALKEDDLIWGSGSSKIWARQNKSGYYDVRFFNNPQHASDGLFITRKTLNSRIVRILLNMFSVKINDKPLKKEELDSFVRQEFSKHVDAQLKGHDAYYVSTPNSLVGKVGRITKIGMLRTVQGVTNYFKKNWRNIGKSVALTAVGTGALYYFGKSMIILGIIGAGAANVVKNNALVEIAKKAGNRFSRFVFRDGDKEDTGNIKNIVHKFYDLSRVRPSGEVVLHSLNPHYIGSLKPVHADYFADTYKKLKPHTDPHDREWTKNRLLGTQGYRHGTIISEQRVSEAFCREQSTFLTSIETNGIEVDYYPEKSFAYACIRTEPINGHHLAQPLQDIFDAAGKKGRQYVALKHTGNGNIRTAYFSDEQTFPKDLMDRKLPESEDFEAVGTAPKPRIKDVISKNEWRKNQRLFLPTLKEAFDISEIGLRRPSVHEEIRREFAMTPHQDNILVLEKMADTVGFEPTMKL